LLLAASLACGKYGPPVRAGEHKPASRAEPQHVHDPNSPDGAPAKASP
jgi:hypothetical protein